MQGTHQATGRDHAAVVCEGCALTLPAERVLCLHVFAIPDDDARSRRRVNHA